MFIMIFNVLKLQVVLLVCYCVNDNLQTTKWLKTTKLIEYY